MSETKSAHEKKLDEINFLVVKKIQSETLMGRIGCFGSLLCIEGSEICGECADLNECKKELSKTRQAQLANLALACSMPQDTPETPEPIADVPAVVAAPEPEAAPEPTVSPVKATPKKGTVDWAAAIAVVIAEKPTSYAQMTTLLVDTLTSWGGLDVRRYKKFKEIAYKLRDKGLVSFEDHKTDTFAWL